MTEARPSAATSPFVFRRLGDAYREAQKQRAANQQAGLLTRVEPFPYGKGYVVRSVPIHFLTPYPVTTVLQPDISHPLAPVSYPGVQYPVR